MLPSRLREIYGRFSRAIVRSVEKLAATTGPPRKCVVTRLKSAILVHCAGIDLQILPAELFAIGVAQVSSGKKILKMKVSRSGPAVSILLPDWLRTRISSSRTLLTTTAFLRARGNLVDERISELE